MYVIVMLELDVFNPS